MAETIISPGNIIDGIKIRKPRVLRCTLRPNRSERRGYTAKDVGRIACYALRDGATPQEILSELRECAPCSDDTEQKNALERAMEAIAENQRMIVTVLAVAVAVLALMRFFGVFIALIPRALPIALPVIVQRITGMQSVLRAQRAANDSVFAIVQRAAANAGSFLRRAGAP